MDNPLKGKLTISHFRGSGESSIRITLEDDDARLNAAEINMDVTAFAKAVLGCAWQDCTFTVTDSGLLGTMGENKTEAVPVPKRRDMAGKWIKTALKPFEVNGWKARAGDMTNQHHSFNKDGKEFQTVVFFRNVAKTNV